VLTCRHVVKPERSVWDITPYGRAKLTGKVIWESADLDAALIRIADTKPWAEDLFPLQFGELTALADCVTYGYPIVRKTAKRGDHENRPWKATPTTGAEIGRYLISTTMAVPRDREPDPKTGEFRSPWAGLSGAALLSADESVVLGMVVADPERYEASTTEAIRASVLLKDPLFAELVGADEPVPWPPTGKETFADGIVRHSDEIRGLTGIRANLTRLPFVAPAEDSDTHPQRLLSTLSDRADDRGVLLVGAAGVGKTRTCLEVGTLAEEHGWNVVHVRVGEPAVTAEQLAAAIAATTGDVLVIIDYLNECDLSLSTLHARVLPDARRNGRRVALLASARTAWADQQNRDDPYVSLLFRQIKLEPDDDQSGRIRDTVVERLAPDACRILGAERLATLCGSRPVIAMLIAAEFQASAERGTLTADGPVPPSGLLIGWLRRRLREDGLTVPDDDELWNDRPPPAYLQAISAMVAATPQDEECLLSCAAFVLDENIEQAGHLLTTLRAMGWLVDTPQGLATAHDIVADHLLEQCLLRPRSGVVRRQVFDRILASSLSRARSIARYATNLGRLIRELDAAGRSSGLEDRYTDWFDDHIGEIGTLLAEPTTEGATALTALIGSSALRAVVSSCWEELAGPWFERHGRTVPALRLLEHGLKSLAPERRAQLARDAISTLTSRPPRVEEDHLLCALLDGGGVTGATLASTTNLAFRWLNRYGTRDSASFLLVSLLQRPDLPPKTVGARALAWLRTHNSAATGYVIRAFLGRDDMPDEYVFPAVNLAYAHVTDAPEALEASFLLAPLIGHPAVPADRQDRLRELALAWLQLHDDTAEARFILNGLLHEWTVPAEMVAQQAFSWLGQHGEAYYARPVIVSLIERVQDEARSAAMDQAFRWLTRHWGRLEASYVLEQLIKRRQTLDIAAYVFDWLREHGTEEVATYVLTPLLARPDLTEQDASAIVTSASRWLRLRDGAFEVRFVLEKLLRRPDLPEKVLADHMATAFRWLDKHRSEVGASFILEPIILRRDLDRKVSRQAISEALTWLRIHHTVRDASYVFLPLLRHPLLDPNERIVVAKQILAWIDENEDVSLNEIVSLLLRKDYLPGEICTELADRAIVRSASGKNLRWPLYYGSLELSLKVAFRWLATHGTNTDAALVLSALLSRKDVIGEPVTQAATHALEWLNNHTPIIEYGLLLRKLLTRHAELTDEHFETATKHALIHLKVRADKSLSGIIIAALLDDQRLTELHLIQVKNHARTWLGIHGDGPHAEAVRAALNSRD
jgi:hypothetical protein